MRSSLIILFSVALANISSGVIWAETDPTKKENSSVQHEDPFLKKKSDIAIKPFVFPKSMVVVQRCFRKAACLVHNPGLGVGSYYEDMVGVNPDQTNEIFSNKTRVKNTLLKIDPARIAPVSLGENLQMNPKGYWLYEKENAKYNVDFILYYRITFNHADPEANVLTEGRIYLTRQRKILIIPSNRQSVPFKHPGMEYDGKHIKEIINVPPDVLANMKNLMKEAHIKGLRRLAKDARKVIYSHKFEKRRSNY